MFDFISVVGDENSNGDHRSKELTVNLTKLEHDNAAFAAIKNCRNRRRIYAELKALLEPKPSQDTECNDFKFTSFFTSFLRPIWAKISVF